MTTGTEGRNARISGEGTLTGGEYGAITINGAGTLHGDVTCKTLRVNGAGNVEGVLRSDLVVVNGSGRFNRDIQAGEMTVNGDATVVGGAGVGMLNVKGRMTVHGGIHARAVDIKGELNVGADLQAEELSADGAFKVDGLLNAGVVDVRLYGPCRAREIGGERITVGQSRRFAGLNIFTFFAEKRLVADTVEGDVVSLELTSAKVVRGRDVTLGEGCEIDLVEYSGELRQAAGAVVRQATKVGG